MAKPLHPSPYNPRRASCEICWADSSETIIYLYRRKQPHENSTYCDLHYGEITQADRQEVEV
jgi:hypothetical protein